MKNQNYKTKVSNSEFSKTNKKFKEFCKIAGVEPTVRQASKWRNQKGSAYKLFKA